MIRGRRAVATRYGAGETEAILADLSPRAYVDELGDDEVSIRVHYWIPGPTRGDIFAVRSYARAARDRLEAEGIDIAPAAELDLTGRIGLDDTPLRD